MELEKSGAKSKSNLVRKVTGWAGGEVFINYHNVLTLQNSFNFNITASLIFNTIKYFEWQIFFFINNATPRLLVVKDEKYTCPNAPCCNFKCSLSSRCVSCSIAISMPSFFRHVNIFLRLIGLWMPLTSQVHSRSLFIIGIVYLLAIMVHHAPDKNKTKR